MAASDKDKKTLQGMIARGQDLNKVLQSFPELDEAAKDLYPGHFGLPLDLSPSVDNKQDFQSSIAENLARYRAQHGGSGSALAAVGAGDEVQG